MEAAATTTGANRSAATAPALPELPSQTSSGPSYTSQLYRAFKQGDEHAKAMACNLMTNLGSNLADLCPELCNNSVVVPIMGHDEVCTLPECRTFALAAALDFGEVNTGILTHEPS